MKFELPSLVILALVAANAQADRLINIPIGRKVPLGVVRFQTDFQTSSTGNAQYWMDWGVNTNFDVSLRYSRLDGDRRNLTGDVSYNYVAPIVDLTPGISVGVQDIGDKTQLGRRAYLAMTYKIGLDGDLNFTPAELTLGVQYGSQKNAFVGILLPVAPKVRFLAEHDGAALNAGIDYQPRPDLAIRWLVKDSTPNWSIRFQKKL